MKYFKNGDQIYTNGTDTPDDPSHTVVTQDEIDGLENKGSSEEQYIEKIKKALLDNFNDISKEEMIEFTAAFNEFSVLGKVKLERYPLVISQIEEWTQQGLL